MYIQGKGREGAEVVQWTQFNGLTVFLETLPILPQEMDEDKEFQDSYYQTYDTCINTRSRGGYRIL